MQPEVEPTPADPVYDDAAYKALRDRRWAMDSELHRVERERQALHQAERQRREQEESDALAARLMEKYPSLVSAEIYRLAVEKAEYQKSEWDDPVDPAQVMENYKELVDLVNAAIAAHPAEAPA